MSASPAGPSFSVLDLLDLPPSEREVFMYVARHGPATAAAIAAALEKPPEAVGKALEALAARGRLRLNPRGVAEVRLGRIASRTTLPTQMWPALLAPQRLYSEQEIATLRTALPMLQFARAKMTEFADHGPNHVLRVKSFVTQLSYIVGLTETERRLVRAAALFHDIGNVIDRHRHHLISEEIVGHLLARGELPFTATEAELVGRLCRWHRKDYEPDCVDMLRGEPVRTGLAASLLRVADAMDIDSRRSDYDQRQRKTLEFFYPTEVPYWTSLEEVAGVRVTCAPGVNVEAYTHGEVPENIQLAMLRRELAGTPLGWTMTAYAVDGAMPALPAGRAWLAFPFDAHSLVMAALSRAHLEAAGLAVDVLCYPDTVGGTAWLWGEALAEADGDHNYLVVIGDRPDPRSQLLRRQAIERWRGQSVTVSLLNRHEASWADMPQLLARGVHVSLGGDWAYFWGRVSSPADLAWGRIAALCARDPTLAAMEVSAREQAVVRGLLNAAFQAVTVNPPNNTDGWRAAAETLMERIALNDGDFFAGQAADFASYATAGTPSHVDGQAVVFYRAPGPVPQTYYWILEGAIEAHGRSAKPGVRYNVPYAVATWPQAGEVELLAINHWRDESALPIRLLYPSDLGPPPGGTENVVHVRLPANEAALVLEALLAAINRA